MATDDGCRQAVIVIHGIGEQKPMQTLRRFVEALFDRTPPPPWWQRLFSWWQRLLGHAPPSDQEPPFHSKPDRLTDTLELRRLNWSDPQDPDAIETDFYELYWAHLMQGTVWSHVIAWLRVLMFRIPFFDAGRGVIVLWILSWTVCLSAIAYLAYHRDMSSSELVGTGASAALALVVFRAFVGSLGLRYVGDAARYLSPTPQNIEARKNIRNAVIQLLTRMHEESPFRYHRIVVVGHSLGSVIAYDALTHFWQQRHSTILKPRPSMQPKMEVARTVGSSLAQSALKRSGEGNSNDLHERYRIAQRELLTEQLELGVSWRISDLVTLGSPLTHACFLLAENLADWRDLLRERVYPTCPPQPEDSRDTGKPKQSKLEQTFFYKPHHNNLEHRLPHTDENSFRLKILHHAALFACTRWTNLYFPSDPVGGELTGVSGFGNGIKDVRLKPAEWLTRTLVSHVHYWDRKERHAIEELLAALDLKDSVGRATSTDVDPAHHFDATVR